MICWSVSSDRAMGPDAWPELHMAFFSQLRPTNYPFILMFSIAQATMRDGDALACSNIHRQRASRARQTPPESTLKGRVNITKEPLVPVTSRR